MEILAGRTITDQFTLRSVETGEAANADAPPTAKMVRNGTDTTTTVTITNVATGSYRFRVTIPAAWVPYDRVAIRVRATVEGVLNHRHGASAPVCPGHGGENSPKLGT